MSIADSPSGPVPKLALAEEPHLTIQGEGKLMGTPTVFLRLQICNQRCVWCDSKFTWEGKGDGAFQVPDVVGKLLRFNTRHVCVTGGEPLLQHRALGELCRQFRKRNQSGVVSLETAGSLYEDCHREAMGEFQFITVSPKIFVEGANCPPESMSVLENVLTTIEHTRLSRRERFSYQFKFVVEKETWRRVVKAIADHLNPFTRIVFQPQTFADDFNGWYAGIIDEFCKKGSPLRNWNIRFMHRLHLQLWGDERGR